MRLNHASVTRRVDPSRREGIQKKNVEKFHRQKKLGVPAPVDDVEILSATLLREVPCRLSSFSLGLVGGLGGYLRGNPGSPSLRIEPLGEPLIQGPLPGGLSGVVFRRGLDRPHRSGTHKEADSEPKCRGWKVEASEPALGHE